MANFRSIYKAQFIFTILIHISLALYEDQVGKFDWKRSFVGKVKYVSLEAKKLIVATEENVLASLDLKNGEIQWRQILEDPLDQQIQFLHVDKLITTVSGNRNQTLVRQWELNTGSLISEWTISVERESAGYFTISNSKLYHIVPTNNQVDVTSYSLLDPEGPINRKISAPWLGGASECITSGSFFACLTSQQLHFLDMSTHNQFHSRAIETSTNLISFNENSILIVHKNLAKLCTFTGEKADISQYNLMPNAVNVDQIYQLEASSDKTKPIRVTSRDFNGKLTFSLDLEYPPGLGAPIILGGCSRGSNADLLLATTDSALVYLRLPEGKILWTREEALSGILTSEFVELPVSELDASIEHEFDLKSDILSMFVNRILTQTSQLNNLLFGSNLLENSGLVRDEFGLHKIIIVATRSGKLFAVDTLSGQIAWSYRLPNVQPFLGLNNEETMLLYTQRGAQYRPLSALCVLLAQDSVTGQGIMFQFDPITGKSKDGIVRLSYAISQAMLLNQPDGEFVKPVLVLSDRLEPHVYPSDVIIKDTYVYTVDHEKSILSGYKLDSKLVGTWHLNLNPGKIVSISAKPSNERVHSQGKVLFDRSVYYKYINPNLIALAVIYSDPIHRSVLTVYLIDGVSGLILHSTSHKKCKEPVNLVHSENWLVYSYFNERFRRTEVAAMELYEGHLQSNSTVFSSFAVSQLPDIRSQAYILPTSAVKMGVTLTERGITNKFLLMGLSNGAVMEIPWLLLQPRFPNSPCGPEESCIPYMPEIPIHGEAIINYNQSLGRIRGLSIAPARLESTSHVLVYGLDIFYTRVAPSKTFDLLKEDFDYRLIVLVLLGLVAATFITKHLASRKALKQAWK